MKKAVVTPFPRSGCDQAPADWRPAFPFDIERRNPVEITYRAVSRFVERFGKVDVIDTEGKTKIIEDDPGSVELVERTADKFHFNGIWYNREEFGRLLERRLLER